MNPLPQSICLLVFTAALALAQQQGPKISPQYSKYFVLIPTELKLQCAGPSGSSLEWLKDGEPTKGITVFGAFQGSTVFSNISISNTSFANSGNYECRVKESGSSVQQPVSFFKVMVTNTTYKSKSKEPLVMQCLPEFQGIPPRFSMEWQKNNTVLEHGDKYKINRENYTLEIHDPTFAENIGVYQCVFTFESTPVNQTWVVKVNVLAQPKIKPFALSKNLIQEERLELNCEAKGNPMPTVYWMKDDERLKPSKRVSFESFNGLKNATLIINSVEYEDRGSYMCVAESTLDNGTANSTVIIRVKDKLAALWPFLGIVAEVFILCVIIFIYERRRAKHEEDEDDMAAGAGSAAVDHKGNDEVRQRNVRT